MRLNDLDFMDLYIRLDEEDKIGATPATQARYKPADRALGPINLAVPSQYVSQIQMLTDDFRRDFVGSHEGIFIFNDLRFRAAVAKQANGETWAALRRISPYVRSLAELRFMPPMIAHLRKLSTRNGLILVSGATGAGKTTTMYGMMREFLETQGGTAITIEDPVEYTMEGPIGEKGYCYQIQVNDDDDWARFIKDSLRWTPRYIIVGEIRTPRAAEQALRAATTGHCVMTSVHAGSVEESLYGILHLAEQTMGDSGARHILAAGLTACLHQQLNPSGPFLRYALTEENNNGDAIRSLIRENRIGMINTFIDRQSAKFAQAVRTT